MFPTHPSRVVSGEEEAWPGDQPMGMSDNLGSLTRGAAPVGMVVSKAGHSILSAAMGLSQGIAHGVRAPGLPGLLP